MIDHTASKLLSLPLTPLDSLGYFRKAPILCGILLVAILIEVLVVKLVTVVYNGLSEPVFTEDYAIVVVNFIIIFSLSLNLYGKSSVVFDVGDTLRLFLNILLFVLFTLFAGLVSHSGFLTFLYLQLLDR